MFFFVYGNELYCVRVGISGRRPLVYAAYSYSSNDALPYVPGQKYHTITRDQYYWLHDHRVCNVSFVDNVFPDNSGNLECRTHNTTFKLFDRDRDFIPDPWDDREV